MSPKQQTALLFSVILCATAFFSAYWSLPRVGSISEVIHLRPEQSIDPVPAESLAQKAEEKSSASVSGTEPQALPSDSDDPYRILREQVRSGVLPQSNPLDYLRRVQEQEAKSRGLNGASSALQRDMASRPADNPYERLRDLTAEEKESLHRQKTKGFARYLDQATNSSQ